MANAGWLYSDTYIGNTARGAGGSAAWLGIMAMPDVDAVIDAVRVYKPVQQDAATGYPPNIALYDYDTGQLVQTWAGSSQTWPADNAAGWVQFAVSPTYAIPAGRRVVAMFEVASTYGYAWDGTSPTMSQNSGMAWWHAIGPVGATANYSGDHTGSTRPAPSTMTWQSGYRSGVDIHASTSALTESDLSQWFSTDADIQTHETDGIPWNSWQRIQQIVSSGGDITTGDVTTYGLSARTIGAAVVKLLAFVVQNGQGITSWLSWLSTPNRPGGQDAIDVILNRIDLQTANGQSHSQWGDGAVLDPALHTQVDSQAFTGQIGWGSGYALHRVHIDTSDDRHPMIDIGAAGFWVPGFGWWAPVFPDGSVGQRQPLEFADQWLWPCPAAANGVIVWCHPSSTGTIYAYSVV